MNALAGRWIGAFPLTAVLLLPGCAKTAEETHVIKEPVTIAVDAATGLGRLTLTQMAAERLGIETATVEEVGDRKVVPSGAVIVSAEGERYVYVNREGFTFTREPVVVDYEDGGRAWLVDGPPPGTRVVTYGAAELFGAETGIK